MNIAVFADLHGRLLLAFKLCARWQRETGEHLDLILQAGDLGAYPDRSRLDRATLRHAADDPTELGFSSDFVAYRAEVAAVLQETDCPLVFVPGNHEDHAWLDEVERTANHAIFPVDVYRRVFCLRTGVPYRHKTDGETITVLGIGRTGTKATEQNIRKPAFIQADEAKRLSDLPREQPIDVLLTHDSPRDFVSPGYGMAEIRQVLDLYRPVYHFYGHTGQPQVARVDANDVTLSCKMADLHWENALHARQVPIGVMGLLRWHTPDAQTFEVVDANWLQDYRASTWLYV